MKATEVAHHGVGARDRSTMPKGHAQPAGGLPGDQLAAAGDVEGGLLDGLGDLVKRARP